MAVIKKPNALERFEAAKERIKVLEEGKTKVYRLVNTPNRSGVTLLPENGVNVGCGFIYFAHVDGTPMTVDSIKELANQLGEYINSADQRHRALKVANAALYEAARELKDLAVEVDRIVG